MNEDLQQNIELVNEGNIDYKQLAYKLAEENNQLKFMLENKRDERFLRLEILKMTMDFHKSNGGIIDSIFDTFYKAVTKEAL